MTTWALRGSMSTLVSLELEEPIAGSASYDEVVTYLAEFPRLMSIEISPSYWTANNGHRIRKYMKNAYTGPTRTKDITDDVIRKRMTQ